MLPRKVPTCDCRTRDLIARSMNDLGNTGCDNVPGGVVKVRVGLVGVVSTDEKGREIALVLLCDRPA